MAALPAPLTISSLRGGLDDSSPPLEIAHDACTLAENVEFVNSALGERRKGAIDLTLPAAFTGGLYDGIAMLARHLPSNSAYEADAQLWALAASLSPFSGASVMNLQYRDQTTWNAVTVMDSPDVNYVSAWPVSAVSYALKLFFAIKTSVVRSYVWDGTAFRRTGLAAPVAPAVANQGAGTLTGKRYYRVRYSVTGNTQRNRMSEPSPSASITPSGAGLAVRVSKPVTISEGETDWVVEASLNNADFFVIATLPVATLFYDDTTPYTGGYAAVGPLSADIGDYTLLPDYRYSVVDNDRLIMGSSYGTAAYGSRIWWTPVGSAPGVGNNERLELDTDPYLDLDPSIGGDITGFSRSADGYVYVFKSQAIYKLVRTNQRTKAYQAYRLTTTMGAKRGSIVEGVDELGASAIYFLDQNLGPCRISSVGLQWCGRDVKTFWSTVNVLAIFTPVALYYPAKRQVHFNVAINGSQLLNAKMVLHTNYMRPQADSVRRGWVTVPEGDIITTTIFCGVMFSDNVDSANARNLSFKPVMGTRTFINPSFYPRLRLSDTGTTDVGVNYFARVRTAGLSPTDIINRFGIMSGTLVAKPSTDTTGLMHVKCVPNYNKGTSVSVTTTLGASASETQVIKPLDNLSLSDLFAVQFEFGDLNTGLTPLADWSLNGYVANWRVEERA